MQRQVAGSKPQRMAQFPCQLLRHAVGNIVQRIHRRFNLKARFFGYVGGLIDDPGDSLIRDVSVLGYVIEGDRLRFHAGIPRHLSW